MKPHEILKAEAPSVELLGMAAAAQIMAKARVSAYTRKDGAFVPEHDRKVKASAKPAGKSSGGPKAVHSVNKGNGFFGTLDMNSQAAGNRIPYDQIEKIFTEAAHHLVDNGYKPDLAAAREFLDGKYGRHLANDYHEAKGDWSKTDYPPKAKPAGGAPAAVKAAADSLGGDAEWKHEAGVSHNIHPLTPSRASAVEDALADSGWEKSGDDTYKHPEGHVASLAGGKLKITHGDVMKKARVSSYTRKDGVFVAEHHDSRQAAKPDMPGQRRSAAAKPAAPARGKPAAPAKGGGDPKSLGFGSKALRASSKDGDMDHVHNQLAADRMDEGDFDGLKSSLRRMDTAARDHILDHIHPDHWSGLGYEPMNLNRSKDKFHAKFGVNGGGDAAARGKPAAKSESQITKAIPMAFRLP